MSFEFFKNPFNKTPDDSAKFESLRDSLNSQSNRKGLQYPIDLGVKDQQNFLLFTIYDNNPQSFSSSETSTQRQNSGTFDTQQMKQVASAFGGAQLQSALSGISTRFTQQAVSNFYKNKLDDPLHQSRLKQDTTQTQSVTSKTRFSNKLNKTKYSIALYMPDAIKTSLEMKYNGQDFSVLQSAGLAGGDIINKLSGIFKETENMEDGAALDVLKNAGIKVGLESIDSVSNIAGVNLNASNAISAARRKVSNPHMEFLFDSIGQRSYSFDFKFVPRNIEEAKAVHDIVRIFRSAGLPSKSKGGVMLDFPSEFDIQYFRGGIENTWIPRISRCYLQNIEVNYTPNEGVVQTHAVESFNDITGFNVNGPAPASMSLSLDFAELSTLLREDVIEGGF